MGAVFFVGSTCAVEACATGGCAPMAFMRSIIARRVSAFPSTSTDTGKPSMLAAMVNLAPAGAGCLDSMGVTLEVLVVIAESFQSCGLLNWRGKFWYSIADL